MGERKRTRYLRILFRQRRPYGRNTAKLIGAEAQKYGVEITAHAPYFINFANPDDEKGEKNGFYYLLDSMRILGFMGGNRVVFHSGTETKQKREVALENIIKRLTIFKDVKNPKDTKIS